MSGDSLAITTELKGIRAALDGLKDLKQSLGEAKSEANDLGEESAEAMRKIKETTSDTLEVLDRLGTAAFLDDFSDRIKYAGEAFSVAEDSSRSFAVRSSAAIAGVSGIVGMFAQNILSASAALASGAAAAEQNERAARTLGAAWGEVQRQTQDTVSAQQALAMQQSLVRSGMSTTAEEMGVLARAAREYALATGTDTPAAMTALTQALQQGDREGLRPFKISVQEGTTRSEAYRQALNQLRTGQEGTAASARSFAEDNERLSRTWTEMTNSLFGDIARWTDLRSNIVGVTQALEALRNEGGISGHGDAHRADSQQRTRNLERRDSVGRLMMATARRLNYRGTLINPNQLTDQQMEFIERALSPLNDEEEMRAGLEFASAAGTNLQASRAANAQAAADAERAARAARDRELRAQDQRDRAEALSPEERRRRALEAAQRAMANDVRRKRAALQGQLTNEYAANSGSFFTDDMSLDIDASLEAQNAMRSQVEDKQRAQLVFEAEQERARLSGLMTPEEYANAARGKADESDALGRRAGERDDLGLQIKNRLGSGLSVAQNAAQAIGGAFDLATQGLNTFVDTLIESPEKIGAASLEISKQFLKGLAVMMVQKAIASTADGIIASLSPATAPLAAGYFAAAGIYAGVAAAAGAGAAGISAVQKSTAPQATPPMSNGTFASAGGFGAGGGERGPSVHNYYINSAILDPQSVQETFVRIRDDVDRRGI